MLGTVAKAGRVLELFTVTRPEWGVCEVAERLQIPKSTAHGLLATLCDIGLMRRSPGGRYRLGWRIVELNRTLVDTSSLAGTRPVLRQLADKLGATADLGALRHHRLTVLDRAIGAPAVNHGAALAIDAPSVHSSALGKVLLAHAGSRAIGAFLDDDGLASHTPHTISCATRLRSELNATRLRGLGYDIEESRLGLCSIAAPIRDTDGSVHTAISLTLPALPFRRNRELLSRSVARAAARISKNARSAGPDFEAAGR
jgi:DNA-binding IclR family transcriptional regulator